MRKLSLLLTLIGLLSAPVLNAQYSLFKTMSYQGVARNAGGTPVANQVISVRFQLQYGLSDAYIETQSLTTNAFGVFSAQIGEGTPVGGAFPSYDAIDWWGGYVAGLQVWIDITGGTNYVQAGGTSLRSVPFAALSEQSFALLDSSLYSSPTRVFMKPTARMGLGTETPQSLVDVEGGMSIGATYSGTTAAPANGLIEEGNTGIGTSDPQAKLHVVGATRLVDGTQGAGKVLTSDASGNAAWSTVVSAGDFTTTWTTTGGFTSAPSSPSCSYSRVGSVVNVVCRFGGAGPTYAAGTNTATLTVPPGLPIADPPNGPLVSGTFISDHYRNGSQTSVGIVANNTSTTVLLKMNGSNAGVAGSYCSYTYRTSAP